MEIVQILRAPQSKLRDQVVTQPWEGWKVRREVVQIHLNSNPSHGRETSTSTRLHVTNYISRRDVDAIISSEHSAQSHSHYALHGCRSQSLHTTTQTPLHTSLKQKRPTYQGTKPPIKDNSQSLLFKDPILSISEDYRPIVEHQ